MKENKMINQADLPFKKPLKENTALNKYFWSWNAEA